jgi:hypothetical protein
MALIWIWLYYLKEQNIIWEEAKEFLFQQIFSSLATRAAGAGAISAINWRILCCW